VQEKLIGRVVKEWTFVENCLHELIWVLTGLSFEDGRLFTERMDPSRSIALLRVLGPRYLKGQQLQTLVDALTRADQLRSDRNFIAHGTWSDIQPEGQPTASSIREKSEPGQVIAEHFPVERMRAIAAGIIRTRDEIAAIIQSFSESPYD
jgi:hypothetical protein